jgi:hypothetical protein
VVGTDLGRILEAVADILWAGGKLAGCLPWYSRAAQRVARPIGEFLRARAGDGRPGPTRAGGAVRWPARAATSDHEVGAAVAAGSDLARAGRHHSRHAPVDLGEPQVIVRAWTVNFAEAIGASPCGTAVRDAQDLIEADPFE